MTRLAVFASGRGSNFKALAVAAREGVFPGRIALLLCDQPDAGALAIAADHGIPARVIAGRRPAGRLGREVEIAYRDACRDAGVEWICLAGFMRVLGATLLAAYPDRIVNIHPSLLPAFPGLDAQRQAWDYGVRVSGCTVHLVDGGVDTGPIVLQRAVPVLPADAPADLAARILAEEHTIYAEALRLLLTRSWQRRGRRIIFAGEEADR
jgi:phosphoribosylglycinamide formyltransferase-1